MPEDEFEEYWRDLRRGILPSPVRDSVDLVSIQIFHAWLQDADNRHRPSFFLVSGGNREQFYRRFQDEAWLFIKPGRSLRLLDERSRSWLRDGALPFLTQSLKTLEMPLEYRSKGTYLFPLLERGEQWEVLWGLLACSYLVIENDNPLWSLLDQGERPIVEVIRSLSTFRALAAETADPQRARFLVEAFGHWIDGTPLWSLPFAERELLRQACPYSFSTEERLEAIQFILTLAKQNEVVGTFGLSFDGVENIALLDQAEDLYKFILSCEKWVHLSSPLCPVLGWREAKEDVKGLRKIHSRLTTRLVRRSQEVKANSEKELV